MHSVLKLLGRNHFFFLKNWHSLCGWHCVAMCENYEDPSESRKTQADGHRTTAELDSSLFNGESPVQISERTRALRCETWEKFFDKDGRVVNESALRKAVFKGNF